MYVIQFSVVDNMSIKTKKFKYKDIYSNKYNISYQLCKECKHYLILENNYQFNHAKLLPIPKT